MQEFLKVEHQGYQVPQLISDAHCCINVFRERAFSPTRIIMATTSLFSLPSPLKKKKILILDKITSRNMHLMFLSKFYSLIFICLVIIPWYQASRPFFLAWYILSEFSLSLSQAHTFINFSDAFRHFHITALYLERRCRGFKLFLYGLMRNWLSSGNPDNFECLPSFPDTRKIVVENDGALLKVIIVWFNYVRHHFSRLCMRREKVLMCSSIMKFRS